MTLLSVSQRFLPLSTFVKQGRIIAKSFIERILRKVSQMNMVKVVVIFGIFGAIDAMVLPISPKRIALGSCACAQIEALEEGNRWIHPDDYWNLSERGRNAANLIIHYNDSDGLFCLFSQISVTVLLIESYILNEWS